MKFRERIRRYRWGLGAAWFGVALLTAAFFVPDDSAWQGAFLNVGAAALLLLPIAIVSRNLHDEMESFEEDQGERLEAVEKRSESKIQELQQRLAHLEERDAAVLQQQQEDRRKDDERFDAITNSDATGLTLWRALRLAETFKLVSPQGVHVAYAPNSSLTVVFSRSAHSAHSHRNAVNAQLFDGDGKRLWPGPKRLGEKNSLDTFLADLNRVARTQRDHSGATVSAIFGRLAEALKNAASDTNAPFVGPTPEQAVGRRESDEGGADDPY